jgi:GAF domain-containing protein
MNRAFKKKRQYFVGYKLYNFKRRNYTFLNTFTKTFKQMSFELLKPQVETIILDIEKPVEERLLNICSLLEERIAYYNWVGFYFKNGDKNELKLGPYVGEPTDHVIIPFGKGICGQVALSNENFVVPDVAAQDNYIACSITVKAEIVVPIFINGENIGQIDIDSNTADPFTKSDEHFLEFVCAQVATIL